jgi:hypothetical protein
LQQGSIPEETFFPILELCKRGDSACYALRLRLEDTEDRDATFKLPERIAGKVTEHIKNEKIDTTAIEGWQTSNCRIMPVQQLSAMA